MRNDDAPRAWALDTARALLAEVRAHTERAVERVDALHANADADRAQVDDGVRTAIDRWMRAMEALGVQVEGPWRVHFDTGDGYFCWHWPETELAWFHGYDAGEEEGDRIRIQ